MRSIKIALALVFVAASAHAEPAVYPGLIPDYQKLEPSGAYVFNATDGQWHANSSTNPLYCSVTSGGNGGTVDLTKLNGDDREHVEPATDVAGLVPDRRAHEDLDAYHAHRQHREPKRERRMHGRLREGLVRQRLLGAGARAASRRDELHPARAVRIGGVCGRRRVRVLDADACGHDRDSAASAMGCDDA